MTLQEERTCVFQLFRKCSRLCWLVCLVGAVVLNLVLVAPIYSKWRNSPTYTSINTTNYPVWDIPFPGVTICSNILINWEQIERKIKKKE